MTASRSVGSSCVLALLVCAAPLRAETEAEIELGYEFVGGDFGSEKFNEYRDAGPGLVGRGRVFYVPETLTGMYFEGAFHNPGNRDQAYEVRVGRWEKFALDLHMSQLPHVFSRRAASPYGDGSAGSDSVLALPGGFVRTPAGLAGSLTAFGIAERLAVRQRNWSADLSFQATDNLVFHSAYELLDKQGSRPNSLLFGFFTNFVEVAEPVDEKTHNTEAGLSWRGDTWTFDLSYEGSSFRNEFDSSIIDNPIQAVDIVGTSSRGQLAGDPDNTSHQLSAAWTSSLPQLGFPARVSASLSYALRSQDEGFLATTVNTALAAPAILQEDLDGDVRSLVGNVQLIARPRPGLTVKARYRLHDHDNRTDAVFLSGRVQQDANVSLGTLVAPSRDFRRQSASLDLGMRLSGRTRVSGGYEWQNWNRDRFREVTHVNEHIARLRLDTRVGDQTRVRLGYEHGRRNGNDYEVVDPTNLLSVRTYDQADRRRHKLDLFVTRPLGDRAELTFRGGFEDSDFNDSDHGLTDSYSWHAGTDLSMQVSEEVQLAAYYVFERGYQTVRAREWNPGIGNTPAGDWKSRLDDRAHTIGVEATFELTSKLTASMGWDFHFGKVEQGAAGDLIGAGAFDFPSVKNNWQIAHATLEYALSEQLMIKTGYRLERYNGDDFRIDGLGLNTTGSDVYLGDLTEDYRASIIAASFVYTF